MFALGLQIEIMLLHDNTHNLIKGSGLFKLGKILAIKGLKIVLWLSLQVSFSGFALDIFDVQ